ncbi:MAG: hypothetical protein ACREOW_18510 [Thermodesulfobacteriota bacterium]
MPKNLVNKYKLDLGIVLEEKEEGILIKPVKKDKKLSWEETYREMAKEKEDWDDLDITVGDGI